MKSPSFGKRLFRLLLLFSLIPSILLALLGYYLAIESSELRSDNRLDVRELTDYFAAYTASKLDSCLTAYQSDTSSIPPFLDFAFYVTPEGGQLAKDNIGLDSDDVARILEAAFGGDRIATLDGQIVQFAIRSDRTEPTLCVGIAHNDSYVELLQSLQSDLASKTVQRDLKPQYALFLGVVFTLLSGIIVIVAYVLSNRLAKGMAQPISELSAASEDIAGGDFSRRVDAAATGEIAVLIESFNAMARRLQTTTDRLAQTERVAAWRKVARRFAHELKNPLQPIAVSLYRIEKLVKETDVYDRVREPLTAASEELKHLTELAERFSALAKLPPPTLERVDLGQLIASVAELYRERMTAFQFAPEIGDGAIVAEVDPTYFRETLHNLLQNAMDATPEGGKIALSARAVRNAVVVAVEDNGCGMSNDTIASARLPYFSTKKTGNGLGLAIVEKVVTECGGQLTIKSEEGVGSKVCITLPSAG